MILISMLFQMTIPGTYLYKVQQKFLDDISKTILGTTEENNLVQIGFPVVEQDDIGFIISDWSDLLEFLDTNYKSVQISCTKFLLLNKVMFR